MYGAALLATFEDRFPNAAAALGYPPPDPRLLIDDRPRREAYLARILANRGQTSPALPLPWTPLSGSTPLHPS